MWFTCVLRQAAVWFLLGIAVVKSSHFAEFLKVFWSRLEETVIKDCSLFCLPHISPTIFKKETKQDKSFYSLGENQIVHVTCAAPKMMLLATGNHIKHCFN